MKEKIVLDFKDVKCAEDKNYVIARKEKCKVEKEPTNWEELKELCKDIKGVELTEEGVIDVGFVYFTKDGDVTIYIKGVLMDSIWLPIAEKLTPSRQLQIIKALVGE